MTSISAVLLTIILATHAAGTVLTIWFYIFKKYRNVNVFFAWYDIWVGGYYDRKNDTYYYLPIPMIGFTFKHE